MIAHSNNFKNAIIKAGRDIKIHIDYFYQVFNLKTEDNKLIITQDNAKLLTEEIRTSEPSNYMTEDDIVSIRKNNLGELFRTYMKSFDIETTIKFNVGDKMIIKIGTTVNGEPEYLNYGMYYVYEKKYNEESKTYTYTICDRILFTMQKYENSIHFPEGTDSLTCEELVESILTEQCGFTANEIDIDYTAFANRDQNIYVETFKGINVTCRDVLDMIMQVNGCSLVINYDSENHEDYISERTIGQTSVDTINEDILNTSKIQMVEKFGALNSLLFSKADGIDNIEAKDTSSIETNGMTRYVIKDNPILEQDNREEYLNPLFNQIKGLEYYVCDIDTIGLYYIEYLDRFDVSANNNLYHCLCLKNTGEIQNGMSESFKTESPEEKELTFESIGTDDKKASITMDKLKGEIVLKTYQEDGKTKLAQVRLDSSGEEGSSVEISADNISLEGYTTINGDFTVDENGTMSCRNANVTGGNISLTGDETNPKFTIVNSSDNTKYAQYYPSSIMMFNGDTALISMNSQLSAGILSVNSKNSNDATEIRPWSIIVTDGTSTSTITPTSITPGSSLAETKKNIEDNVNALDIIKDIDIYSYNYKSEEDNDKKHIGFIIGKDYNYAKEVTSIDKDGKEIGADIYSFVSVCCKAIQEQQEEIEELKKEINNLKGGNK